jgi:hypothetical protein
MIKFIPDSVSNGSPVIIKDYLILARAVIFPFKILPFPFVIVLIDPSFIFIDFLIHPITTTIFPNHPYSLQSLFFILVALFFSSIY